MTTTAPMVWINGERRDPEAPHVSAFDRGYMRADGLFETLRSYDGKPGCLRRHLERMRRGAAVLGLRVPDELERTIDAAARESVSAGWNDAVIRFSVSRGRGDLTMAIPADVEPTTVVSATPLPDQSRFYRTGISLHVAAGTRNEQSVTAGLKTLGYAESVIAFNAARAAGFDEALFLDTEGHVSEATTANVFAVRGGRVITPPLSCGILAGITRALVLELAARENIPAAEEIVRLEDLEQAEEVFITSSVRELMPVTRIGANTVGAGAPGRVYRRLHERFPAIVRDCA